ncbi:MAG TPA: M56 family metallopeptidase [Terracidiphilus sp.]|nr:M56 family metallopeptidase [Terracidiphilus sp.]
MYFDATLPSLLAAPQAFRALSASLAPVVIAGLWQGLALAAALALALRVAPRLSAAHRFTLWAAGFAALVSLPFLPTLARAAASTAAAAAPAASASAPSAWLQLGLNWSLGLAVLWAAASLWRAVDLLTHSFHLRHLWRSAAPIPADDPRLACLPTVDGRRAPQLCTTTQLDRPSVIGFLAPRILIPGWLLSRLTPGELRQIVLHESEHLRRRDDWTNLLQKLCLVLFPLNPALWFMERRLCCEREMACDEGVVRITRAPRAYAACLASLAERGLQRQTEALSLGAWQRRSELARRVHSLLVRKHALNPVATRALLAVLGCGLLCGSVELARCPQLVAFVPERPAAAQAMAAPTLATRNNLSSAALAQVLPPTSVARRPAYARRVAVSHKLTHVQPSPALLAALQPDDILHSASSAELVSTRSDLSPQLQASNASASSARAPAGQALAPVSAPAPAQEWIVFTTWQQVQTESLNTTSSAGSAQASAERSDKVLDSGTVHHFTTRFTVTRVIFRIIPVSSAPANAPVLPMRESWLVLQL